MVIQESESKIEQAPRRNYPVWVLSILLVLSSGTAFYYYQKSLGASGAAANQASQAEIKALVAQVGRLILLPTGEDPTVASVVDPDLLKNQAFFANATKGNKVLIYQNAKRAILYDPATNKIINVAPVDISSSAQPGVPSPTATQGAKSK